MTVENFKIIFDQQFLIIAYIALLNLKK